MRTIKFRGKDKRSGEWFYGNLFVADTSGRTHVGTPERMCLDTDPATVGQFTGLRDVNGVEIYEGDIVANDKYVGAVKWMPGRCCYQITPGGVYLSARCEVVGNIHDNPELLKGGVR